MSMIQDAIDKAVKERAEEEERRIIGVLAAAGKITAHGFNTIAETLRTAVIEVLEAQEWQQDLVIANAATAAAIRKQYTREEVEVIVSQQVETGTVYVVRDKELKREILANIERRGY